MAKKKAEEKEKQVKVPRSKDEIVQEQDRKAREENNKAKQDEAKPVAGKSYGVY